MFIEVARSFAGARASRPHRGQEGCAPGLKANLMRVLVILLMAGAGTSLAGEPLYIEQYQAAHPDQDALAKAEQPIREHQDVVLRDKMAVSPFHRQPDPLRAGETFCQTCHAPLPHTRKLRDRTFLNMHSRFITCETCHFRPATVQLSYDWLDYASWQSVPGDTARFRTGSNKDNAVALEGRVKIAPFVQNQPAIARRDSAFTREIEKSWKEGDLPQRTALKARLHTPLKKEGPECAACHSEKQPLLDLEKLGATPTQATAIRRHIIPQFFSRYRSDDDRLRIIDILR